MTSNGWCRALRIDFRMEWNDSFWWPRFFRCGSVEMMEYDNRNDDDGNIQKCWKGFPHLRSCSVYLNILTVFRLAASLCQTKCLAISFSSYFTRDRSSFSGNFLSLAFVSERKLLIMIYFVVVVVVVYLVLRHSQVRFDCRITVAVVFETTDSANRSKYNFQQTNPVSFRNHSIVGCFILRGKFETKWRKKEKKTTMRIFQTQNLYVLDCYRTVKWDWLRW